MTAPVRLTPRIENPKLRAALGSICEAVAAAGGTALLVGGSVRDAALGRPIREIDLEVFGLSAKTLLGVLAPYDPHVVGRAFGVIVLRGLAIDVTLPRRRWSPPPRGPRSEGAEGASAVERLEREAAPELDPRDAAVRRDFTVNAMSLDPLSDEVIDPHGGLADLEARVLRHTSEHFGEDPLRVLRAAQLAARFELSVADETTALCRRLSPEGIPRERVFGEWRKLLVAGERPSLGLAFLRECDWLLHFPEIAALVGCPQDPAWHPEGDVFEHTLHCLDAFAAERTGDERDDFVVGLAVLCHDFGKPDTTRLEDGRITSKRHEPVGEEKTRAFLARLTDEQRLIDEVAPLVGAHLKPQQLFEQAASDAAVRRLARRVGRIDRLVRVARADQLGRPPLAAETFPAGDWLLSRAHALAVADSAPEPLVKGRHLESLGVRPGPAFGPLLRACFDAQLEGTFSSEPDGVAYARDLLDRLDRAASG